jgi:CBS domain-containing protein
MGDRQRRDTPRGCGKMTVQQAMAKRVQSCGPEADLAAAARLLWNGDCGVLPIVVGEGRRVVGMLTDRDICMAAWTQGRPLADIPVEIAMASDVVSCRPEEDLAEVLARLRARHVRRLPVVDEAFQLLGIISLVDIARAATGAAAIETASDVCETLASISAPPRDSR